jgi:hypothetical protein
MEGEAMNRIMTGTAAVVVAAAVIGLAMRRFLGPDGTWPRRFLAGSRRSGQPRWQVVTVYRRPDRVFPRASRPVPLAELGDAVEVEARPAPGRRGVELAARSRGDDRRRAVRSALRQAKQLIETGEVLRGDAPPTTRRTLLNRPSELAARRAGKAGRQ